MFSRFFIDRPVLATVLALLMILVGLVAVKSLPVAQYPDITPPTVRVSAMYPGADAGTVAETVGIPIEEQVNGVEGMMYMSSNSGADGSYGLTVTFENGTDLDMATVKVQNRVALAEPDLPVSVRQQGVSVTSESTDIILFVAVEGDSLHQYDGLYLTNYARRNIVEELARIDGVGGVDAMGAGSYSMRVWLDPDVMRVRNVSPEDVMTAIRSQNMEVSAGSVGAPPVDGAQAFQFTLVSKGRLVSVDEFADIVIRSDGNNFLRLKDVAKIDLGSENYSVSSLVSGEDAGLIAVYQTPGANALDVASRVKARLADLEPYFPEGVHYRVLMNTTDFVTSSIDDVFVTLVETTLIVLLIILLFLQNWRTAIIPMITIPVSLIATFAVMKLMGFTINTLTLFGLVLAIAIVVDDAIVVVEDCARIVNEGKMTPKMAARRAMTELQGPVIGEVLVLLSVFIPTAFISGITGELYKQFALTIAVSTAFSGFNALTFTPAMCALFLRPRKASRFILYRWFNKGWTKTVGLYTVIVGRFLRKPLVALGIYVLLCIMAFWGFIKWPESYIPQEDMGYFITSVQLPAGASEERTSQVMAEVSECLLSQPEVDDVISVTGMSFLAGVSGSNLGSFFVVMKPWDERRSQEESARSVVDRLNGDLAGIQAAEVFSVNPPAIPGLGLSSGLQMQLLDINNYGPVALKQAVDEIVSRARQDDRIAQINTLYEGEIPQYTVEINRDKVKLQGLALSSVFSTLSSFMGGSYVNDFVEFGRVYQVNIGADAVDRDRVDDVLNLSVRNEDGKMVPFSSFATVRPSMGLSSVSRYNMYQTASLTATPARHVSASDGIQAMEEIVKDAVGSTFSYSWTGEAYQEIQDGTTISMALFFAIMITLLVLAAQYGNWTDPVAVVISMPVAVLGTIVGCWFMSQSISIYTQIGIILLLGLSAKNAILIVEYAADYRKSGLSVRQAAMKAGSVRFRPIMMTAMAFVFGLMPMLFATGAGAQSRIAIGTAVVFGMAVNALVGTLFVPCFWELLQRFGEKYLSRVFGNK